LEPKQLIRKSRPDSSFTVSLNEYPNFLRIWHFHEEYELVLILESNGIRFVGDTIERFSAGEVVLLGKNLPHMWLNDDAYFNKESTLVAKAISIHFKEDFLGSNFFEIPEMRTIKSFLERASNGIQFADLTDDVKSNIIKLANENPIQKITSFIDILFTLSEHKNQRSLSTPGLFHNNSKTENKRLNKIYEYVFENFNTTISSIDVAAQIGMNSSAFSRFFKKIHRKTFSKYLNEIRVGYACKLIQENNESITAIAYLSGFNNISNFNRQFKLIKGTPPTIYAKRYKNF